MTARSDLHKYTICNFQCRPVRARIRNTIRWLSILGLGTMGRPMARNLIDAGYEVRGWNRSSTVSKIRGSGPG
ncbi:MAG: hypothetical protein JRJ46_00425 [Deltaproteobacteria bacterium]|nr:hypothetical protein [Deltaproteobacteria bacterium]